MLPQVILQNDFNDPTIPEEKHFQRWVDATINHVHDRIPNNVNEVCIRIVDTHESAEMNEKFRQKAGATNILSFPSEIDATLPEESLGDIAICADLVSNEANEQAIPIQDHWAHLTIHGILHLLGYDHINEEDAEVMETLEIQILNSLNIENPYKEPFDD